MVTTGTVLVLSSGAFIGDYLAYRIGANSPLDRIPMLQRTKGQAALQFTQGTFRTRGNALIQRRRKRRGNATS
jgi:hypothetical protein